MFMDPIAAMSRFLMKITWTMCMMVICIISMRIIGMSAPLMDASNTLNMSINMDRIVVMLQSPTVITSTIYTMATYTPPTATTGTNTKYTVSGRGDARSPQVDRPLWSDRFRMSPISSRVSSPHWVDHRRSPGQPKASPDHTLKLPRRRA